VDTALGVCWAEAKAAAGTVGTTSTGERVTSDGTAVFADAVGDLDLLSPKYGPSIGPFQVRVLRDPDAFAEFDRWRRAFPLAHSVHYVARAGLEVWRALGWDAWATFRNNHHASAVGRDTVLLWGHPKAGRWDA